MYFILQTIKRTTAHKLGLQINNIEQPPQSLQSKFWVVVLCKATKNIKMNISNANKNVVKSLCESYLRIEGVIE